MPLLIDRATGVPPFDPTVYVLTEVRARNRAANTIQQHLVAIECLLLYCRAAGIEIDHRVESGELLTIGELDGLTRAVRQPIGVLAAEVDQIATPALSRKVPRKVISLEGRRQAARATREVNVDPATATNRLRVIGAYLDWLSLRRLSRLAGSPSEFPRYDTSRRIMLDALKARIPPGKPASREHEGLSTEARAWLEKVIEPNHPSNPWRDEHVRQRNRLIVTLLYYLGIRRGELLALRVADLDLRRGRLTVARRADDPKDPRRQQPTAKTLSRVLEMSSGLVELATAYILKLRVRVPGARKHGFLFVDTDLGRPLSAPAVEKLFRELRKTSPELLNGLTAHVLRHTWNDKFSEIMDQLKVQPDDEEKQRSYLMGWRDGSGSSAIYTRRYTRKKAAEVSLAMQTASLGPKE